MSADTLAPDGRVTSCAPPGHCPLCGAPNHCRLETGEAYRGPCWCKGPIVSAAALRRLLDDLAEPRCLCRDCLESIAADPEITRETLAQRRSPPLVSVHSPLVPEAGDFYWEGIAMVFTAKYHLRRGSCCGSGCRHCPYRGSVSPPV